MHRHVAHIRLVLGSLFDHVFSVPHSVNDRLISEW
jgi:hypothetical protein